MSICPHCNSNMHDMCSKKQQPRGAKLATLVDCTCSVCWTSDGEAIYGVVTLDANTYWKDIVARFA